ncbi:MAG: FkbM family methyltransferase [Desulfobacteraceae bacterium]|nr:MAG: FkbM family methyltransferase [Desulfobacteraceae bacterium]
MKMNGDSFRINRFFRHIYQGTLLERIREELRAYVKRRRSAWWQQRIGQKEYLTFKLQSELKMLLYFDSRLSQEIYCGYFEWKERQFLYDFLRDGEIFVDIGANIGLFTLIASHKIGKKGQVYSFEPCSKTYHRLVKNIDLNEMSNTKCFQIALSDHTGQVEMNISLDGYDAWNSIVKPTAGNAFAVETVHAMKWDNFAHEHNLMGRVNLMKIDVEGWESHVLSGGCECFGRKDAPVLQIEFTDEASQSAGTSCQSLYRQLEGLGYSMFIYEAKSKRLIPDPIRNSYPYLNLFAAKYPEKINIKLKKRNFLS